MAEGLDGSRLETLLDDLTGAQRALLRNPNRRAIAETLAATPGLNKNQLRKRLDMLPNLLHFHLGRLEERGLVVTKPSAQGNESLCFLSCDEQLWEDEDKRILYGRRSTRELALSVAENPGASVQELAEQLDRAPTTVRHHLRTLRDFDLIERVRLFRKAEYYPDPKLEEWNARWGEAYRSWNDAGTEGPGGPTTG